jgi:hypothetical protein
VWQDYKYVLVTGTGDEELYDLQADPGETKNLAGTTDTTQYWTQLRDAHGITVSHGWRMSIDVKSDATVSVKLPAPATAADVLDPETITRKPANQVWGEKPRTTTSEVGTVSLSEDRKTIQISAGSKGKGTVYVLFDQATSFDGTTMHAGEQQAAPDKKGKMTVAGHQLHIRPGIVLVPPQGEASRIAACSNGEGSQGEVEMLEALGYVGGDE